MNDLVKLVNKRKYFLIALSILFPLGIVGIIIGAVSGRVFLLVPSIIVVVAGFYGLPIGWSQFSVLNFSKNVAAAIATDGITTIKDLANTFGRKEKDIQKTVTDILSKRYITGYLFNDDKTELIKTGKKPEAPEEKPDTPTKISRCVSCGAPLSPDSNGVCPYCHIVN
ncbi:MAG: hypothetical protein LBT30_01295 [Clostridiales bacterium]|jgi:hypothetical protein|nr:hypothetical protein [Clostridiales bacterium]